MVKSNTLDVLKQCFEKIIPCQDARTTINPLEFIVCLVFCYLGDIVFQKNNFTRMPPR